MERAAVSDFLNAFPSNIFNVKDFYHTDKRLYLAKLCETNLKK